MYRSRLSFRHLFFCVSVFLLTMLGFSICKPIADTAHRFMLGSEMSVNDRHSYTLATNFSEETPAMTFLMHGLGGTAADWSNDYTPDMPGDAGFRFVQDSLSIIERMRASSINGINLYRAEYHQDGVYKYYSEYDSDQMGNDTITDFSRHTVVVIDFNPDFTYEPMKVVYDKLHHIIDKFVYDYRKAEDKIPSINLIGHSMGGLLNMQYAIDHPKNVASLISMGTPYNGSWYNNVFVEGLGIKDFKKQPCMAGQCEHGYYFCDLDQRKRAWNTMFMQNRHIKFYALGGQVSVEFISELINSESGFKKYYPANILRDSVLNSISNILPGDMCVDLHSQLADGYMGSINYTKLFTPKNSNLEKKSQNNVALPHNLETYDHDLSLLIISVLRLDLTTPTNSEENNGISAKLVTTLNDVNIIRLTNNTGKARSFDYCACTFLDSVARDWKDLDFVETTQVIQDGMSVLIGIKKITKYDRYGNRMILNSITISYREESTRHVFYAGNLQSYNSEIHLEEKIITCHYYSEHNVDIELMSFSGTLWSIKLTNKTGEGRRFFYNETMCTHTDAMKWTGLTDVSYTDVINNDESVILKFQTLGFSTDITMSYLQGSKRYIISASKLSAQGTLECEDSSVDFVTYTADNKITVSNIGKCREQWLIEITNNTEEYLDFEYNCKLCFTDDAQNWKNLTDISPRIGLEKTESCIIGIMDNGTADTIAISYIEKDDDGKEIGRKIFSANDLKVNGKMNPHDENYVSIYSYEAQKLKIKYRGKNGSRTTIQVTNTMNKSVCLYYNSTKCYRDDSKNWTGLTNIKRTEYFGKDQSVLIEISDNGNADCVAISYIETYIRKIAYLSDISTTGEMVVHESESGMKSYSWGPMIVSNVGKAGNEWLIEIENHSGKKIDYRYNMKMCFDGDAREWNGNLTDQRGFSLEPGEKVVWPIRFWENGTATHIVISYIDGDYRYIFYADNLDPNGSMTVHKNEQRIRYTYQGLTIQLLEKVGTRWHFSLTNNTGSTKKIEYNSKMCLEGDAINWTGLSDVENITLNDKEETEETDQEIWIEENGWSTHVTFSYMDGNIRHVVYACELTRGSCTMNVGENTIDTSAPPSSCVAEGTLVTLADGSQKAVEELTGDELLLVWNLETGTFDSAPIMFIDSDPVAHYEVVKLSFSDGTDVDVISEHGFYDADLNRYVYLDENASDYIGHAFMKQNGMATLTGVSASTIVTRAYSPVTYGHLCYYVNGMLSMPGGISGLFNYFDVDASTMRYDQASMMYDIERYGLYTYDEFSSIIPVSEEVFEAFNGRYLKVAIAKGMITMENIRQLVERYSMYL